MCSSYDGAQAATSTLDCQDVVMTAIASCY
jgi:hypothetical protein